MPADQRRQRGFAILRLTRNDFNAGEADLAVIFEAERPRVDDGAYDAFTLDVELASGRERWRGGTEPYSAEHCCEQIIARAKQPRRHRQPLAAALRAAMTRGLLFALEHCSRDAFVTLIRDR
ncbi:hypothetical protein [Nitrobacter sp.]|uniref:hypothetical protein n=1 Tax=Nitrobacter sp. TaxID=29420 RepID=UPI0025EF2340|nr:hypothetical protein [Nitrobacter sp.]